MQTPPPRPTDREPAEQVVTWRAERAFREPYRRHTPRLYLLRRRDRRWESVWAEADDPRVALPAHDGGRVDLERAIARLPLGYRTVLLLPDLEGIEHEEIGGMLGIIAGTSKSQLHGARRVLRGHLEADPRDAELDAALAAPPRESPPPAGLEQRLIDDLRRQGLLGGMEHARGVRRPGALPRWAIGAQARVALLAAADQMARLVPDDPLATGILRASEGGRGFGAVVQPGDSTSARRVAWF